MANRDSVVSDQDRQFKPTSPRKMEEAELDSALRDVEADRQKDYGPPDRCMQAIADGWQAYLNNRRSGPLNNVDSSAMFAIAKAIRGGYRPDKDDNWLDGMKYLEFAGRFGVKS